MGMIISSGVSIFQFQFKGGWSTSEQYLEAVLDEIHPSTDECEFLLEHLPAIGPSLVLLSVASKEDLLEVARLIEGIQLRRRRNVLLAAVNFTGRDDFDHYLLRLGVRSVVPGDVSFEEFEFNMDFWLCGLSEAIQQVDELLETPVIDALVIDGDEAIVCGIEDFFEGVFCLRPLEDGLPLGQEVELVVTTRYRDIENLLQVRGKITGIDPLTGYAFFEVTESSGEGLEGFLQLYQERQQDVLQFLEVAKGA